jgi:hypothetical protein
VVAGSAVRLASRRFRHRINGRSRMNHESRERANVTVTATTTHTTSFECGSKYPMARNTGRCRR